MTSSPNVSLSLPSRVAHYELEREIGRGGMGVVFQGRDTRSGAPVAIKMVIVREHDHDAEERLAELMVEAEVGARCQHHGLVAVHGFERAGDSAFLAMELLSGQPLSNVLQRQVGISPDFALSLVQRLADATAAAHARGVVHRDIKPTNVMLLTDGRVKLLDFGVAAIEGKTRRRHAGTPAYMAPEQARGEMSGPAADVFSLGVILYELMAGQKPFGTPTFIEVARRSADALPPLLREGVEAPPTLVPLRNILRRALAYAPGDRFPDAASLRDALAEHTVAGSNPPGVPPAIGPALRVRRTRILGAALVAMIVVASAAALVALEQPAVAPRPSGTTAGSSESVSGGKTTSQLAVKPSNTETISPPRPNNQPLLSGGAQPNTPTPPSAPLSGDEAQRRAQEHLQSFFATMDSKESGEEAPTPQPYVSEARKIWVDGNLPLEVRREANKLLSLRCNIIVNEAQKSLCPPPSG